MKPFDYLAIVVSIIIGLGLTELLCRIGRLLTLQRASQGPAAVPFSWLSWLKKLTHFRSQIWPDLKGFFTQFWWPSFVWSLLLFLALVQFWFSFFDQVGKVRGWSFFPFFFFTLLSPVIMYFLSLLVLPRPADPAKGISKILQDNFFDNRILFFFLAMCVPIVNLLSGFWREKENRYLVAPFQIGFALALFLGMVFPYQRFHQWLAPVFLLFFIFFVYVRGSELKTEDDTTAQVGSAVAMTSQGADAMDWLAFFSSVIQSLAWPSAVILILFMLRGPLKELVPLLRKLKYKEFELDFGRLLEKAEAKAAAADLPTGPPIALQGAQPTREFAGRMLLTEIAKVSPRAAVGEAWRQLEHEIRLAMKQKNLAPPANIIRMLELAQKEGVLPDKVMGLLADMLALRHQAVHGPDFEIDLARALEYIDLADRVRSFLRPKQGPNGSP